jgi:hypothetical protein
MHAFAPSDDGESRRRFNCQRIQPQSRLRSELRLRIIARDRFNKRLRAEQTDGCGFIHTVGLANPVCALTQSSSEFDYLSRNCREPSAGSIVQLARFGLAPGNVPFEERIRIENAMNAITCFQRDRLIVGRVLIFHAMLAENKKAGRSANLSDSLLQFPDTRRTCPSRHTGSPGGDDPQHPAGKLFTARTPGACSNRRAYRGIEP